MPKQQPHPQSNLKKIAFSPSSYSDKMRWERGWPKQLFTEKDFSKDLSYSSKVKYIKIYPDIMIKTSRFHHESILVTLSPNLFFKINFATTPNNFSKSRKFSSEISAVEFCHS